MPHPFPNPPHANRGELFCLEFQSPYLANNFWRDPSIRDLWVYTPVDYDPNQQCPIVLFLSGFGSTGETLLSRGLSDVSMARRIDGWIAEGCPPFVAVFPDCMTTLIGSQFVDSPAIGNYASFLMKEVIPFVQNRFGCSSRLGVVGRSSGGYGAIRLAMSYPKINAVACHAGDMAFSTTYCGELTKAILPLQKAGSATAFIQKFWQKNRFSNADFSAMNLLCMSAAYAPDKSCPDFPSNLPVDLKTGEIFFDRFLSWQQQDPLFLIDDADNQQALHDLDFLFLDAGDHDEYLLHLAARRFCEKLKNADIQHQYEEFPGGHRGTSWRYDISIPRLVKELVR